MGDADLQAMWLLQAVQDRMMEDKYKGKLTLVIERDDALDEVEHLKMMLRCLLDDVEWVDTDPCISDGKGGIISGEYCPWCLYTKDEGHTDDCVYSQESVRQ